MEKSINYQNIFTFNWRIAWYSVIVWLLSFGLSGIVILPWFYVVFPMAILLLTHFFFRKLVSLNRIKRSFKGGFFASGLSIGFFWFFSIIVLDSVQFIAFDYASLSVYFFDPRNFIKYPIVILVPIVYGLVLENKKITSSRFKNDDLITSGAVRLRT